MVELQVKALSAPLMLEAKQAGFSDRQIAKFIYRYGRGREEKIDN